MLKTLLGKYTNKFISKWLVLIGDLVIALFCFVVAYLIRFEFDLTAISSVFKYHLGLMLLLKTVCFLYYGSYIGIVRHTTLDDAFNIFKATFTAGIFAVAIHYAISVPAFQVPLSVIAIDAFIDLVVMVTMRLLVKQVYEDLSAGISKVRNVVIYGSGDVGQSLKDVFQKSRKDRFNVICFIDDNSSKLGKSSGGVPVMKRQDFFDKILPNYEDVEVVLAIQNLSSSTKAQYANEFLERGIVLKSIPKITSLIDGDFNTSKIKDVNIEDLLDRDPIYLNKESIEEELREKTILVTGAAGSIGSEITRQLLVHHPRRLVLIDQAESPLYDLETEIMRLTDGLSEKIDIHFEVVNVTNLHAMNLIFERFKPSYVFHAAAYKHVPMMEKNPHKAIKVNVFGTKILADLASKYKVSRFVMVSTDKAVNPTNVMGATKRLAEMYVQSLASKEGNATDFITTRFGNVLGSNGSVVPLFKKQIAAGGPLTVTDKNITRYFMTIPEACQLVLEAGTVGGGQEVYVFDMGSPVKIYDLAVKMVRLAGLQLGKDIEIKVTGLRPGEKLYEELLTSAENTKKTYHPKIMIAKVRAESHEKMCVFLDEMALLMEEDKAVVVKKMKEIMPEYISNNSEFEKLDPVASSGSSSEVR